MGPTYGTWAPDVYDISLMFSTVSIIFSGFNLHIPPKLIPGRNYLSLHVSEPPSICHMFIMMHILLYVIIGTILDILACSNNIVDLLNRSGQYATRILVFVKSSIVVVLRFGSRRNFSVVDST